MQAQSFQSHRAVTVIILSSSIRNILISVSIGVAIIILVVVIDMPPCLLFSRTASRNILCVWSMQADCSSCCQIEQDHDTSNIFQVFGMTRNDCILQSSICGLEAFDLALAAAGGLCQRLRFWFVTQRWNKNIALNGVINLKDGWRMLKNTTEGSTFLVFQSSFAKCYKSLESSILSWGLAFIQLERWCLLRTVLEFAGLLLRMYNNCLFCPSLQVVARHDNGISCDGMS